MKPKKIRPADIDSLIIEIRDQKVILDTALAGIYGVETKNLNKAVKRNLQRFPHDFMFRLSADEARSLRFQFGTLKRGQHIKYLPCAFTEHGAIMAANMLKSPRAIQMSIFVIRAFVKMRSTLIDTRELAQKLSALDKELKGRLDVHEAAIVDILQRFMKMIEPASAPPEPPRPEIGFHIKEDCVPYRVKRRPIRA